MKELAAQEELVLPPDHDQRGMYDDSTLQLGDMTVFGRWPGKMMKALAAISARAHQAYDECSDLPRGSSRDKCLFMSLAVRDFLVQIGFADATVRACFLYIAANDLQGRELWSVGLGAPGQEPNPEKFNGHAVCTVPSLELLIDTTVYQAIRPQWADSVGGMVAIKYHKPWANQLIHGCLSIAGCETELPDRRVWMIWLERPELNWKREIDFRRRNERRRYLTKALREAFGEWRDG
ncbi:hypothetical protein [Bradyrhizobium sp. 170]|uniref:hypothetical protein n=1 Tax=Bradyrhizobium sp. 170 TaxID=2782641 RepID=UPI0020000B16|nr:hypothetical protein [Bradyrhizobium sp. 170]UPK03080.1 hypothetical protein IVB05_36980 [Bradyrhizobium sp. 170]